MVVLNFLSALANLIKEPSGFWEIILNKIFGFVANYGWRIIVFTICLKLVLSPLEIYQRVKMRKNQKITERIKPEIEKLQMQYGSNKQVLQQKQMELNKREGFSYMSACLPTIVTLVIFFWLLSGLNSMSYYMTFKQYVELYDVYDSHYTIVMEEKNLAFYEDKDDWDWLDEASANLTLSDTEKRAYINLAINTAEEAGQNAVYEEYHDTYKVGFLWIKNIWSPDVSNKKPILDGEKFNSSIGKYRTDESKSGLAQADIDKAIGKYEVVMRKLINADDNKSNGYYILPILCVGVSFLSQFVMSRQQKKSGQAAAQGSTMASSMKMMMFIMPVMMGVFALNYTSVFALYIITNSLMTLILNLTTTSLLVLIDKKRDERVSVVRESSGDYDSDTRSARKSKNNTKNDIVLRYGRPDPNDENHNNDKKGG